jgi:acylglycerol lipase
VDRGAPALVDEHPTREPARAPVRPGKWPDSHVRALRAEAARPLLNTLPPARRDEAPVPIPQPAPGQSALSWPAPLPPHACTEARVPSRGRFPEALSTPPPADRSTMISTGLAAVTVSALPTEPRGRDEADSLTLEHGEGTFLGAHRATLYAQWWRPCGPPCGAVAIVHGLKDHSARYGAFAERLVARGFAVHAFDLRGHARSEGPRAWVDAFDDYLGDLDAFVRCIRGREGAAPLFVYGHGMGGSIATLWQLESRACVSGLILSGAALQPGPTPAEARATRLLSALAPRARILQLDVRRSSRDRGTVEDSLRDTLVSQPPAPARTAKELLDAMERIDARAPELAAPLLVMHGTADVVNSPEGSRRLVARARSLDKQLHLYDGLAHDLLHEPEKARVVRDASEWLVERAWGRPMRAEAEEDLVLFGASA